MQAIGVYRKKTERR